MGTAHATPAILVLIFITSAAILYNIFRAKAGRELFVRRIPGLSAVDEAVGRATEMGRPMVFSPGLYNIQAMNTLAAISVLQYIARFAARFGTRLIVSVSDPTVYPVAEEVVKEAYESEGKKDSFRSEDVIYLAGGQFAWAFATMALMVREQAGACFYFGESQAESLMLAETGYGVGSIQIAATDALYQMPFYIAACDYCIFADEYYAASAYLSREPIMTGSLVGQDWSKIAFALLILVGVIFTSVEYITAGTIPEKLRFVELLERTWNGPGG
jgi:hypothetical protein